MSHTPGPWKIAETFGDNIHTTKQVNIRPVDDRNCEHGATCCLVWGADSPECKDNAHLIAASPELLQELENLVFEAKGYLHDLDKNQVDATTLRGAIKRALAIVAKARGQ